MYAACGTPADRRLGERHMDTPRRRPLKVGLFLQTFENMSTRVMPSWQDLRDIAQ